MGQADPPHNRKPRMLLGFKMFDRAPSELRCVKDPDLSSIAR